MAEKQYKLFTVDGNTYMQGLSWEEAQALRLGLIELGTPDDAITIMRDYREDDNA